MRKNCQLIPFYNCCIYVFWLGYDNLVLMNFIRERKKERKYYDCLTLFLFFVENDFLNWIVVVHENSAQGLQLLIYFIYLFYWMCLELESEIPSSGLFERFSTDNDSADVDASAIGSSGRIRKTKY